MGKGIIVGVIVAILAGAALGYGLSYVFLGPGNTVVQTKFSAFRTVTYIDSTTTSPVQVDDAQMSITTSGASRLIVRFTSAYVLYLYQNHNELTRFQVNLTMNDVTESIHHLEAMSDGPVSNPDGAENSGFLLIEFVTEPLPAGTYVFKIMWRSIISSSPVHSQLIFCSPPFNNTRSFFVQEIHI